MKIPRFSNAIGNLDEDLVERQQNARKNKIICSNWVQLAACFAVIIVVARLFFHAFRRRTYTRRHKRRYKDINIMADESGIVWPWEYQTVFEKYTEVTIDGIVYRSHGRLCV